MKIKTEDCVLVIVEHFINKDADKVLQSDNNWKRRSKKGTNPVVREFENIKNGVKMLVYSTDTEILKIEEKTENTNGENLKEFSKFTFVRHFKDAIVFSKEEIKDWEFSDCSKTMNEGIADDFYPYKPYDISADIRIGIIDEWYDEGDDVDEDNNYIKCIIVFKNTSKYYSREEDGLTTDQNIFFELEQNVHFVPSAEPIDLIAHNDAYNFKKEVKKYKLKHLLRGN